MEEEGARFVRKNRHNTNLMCFVIGILMPVSGHVPRPIGKIFTTGDSFTFAGFVEALLA